MGYPPALDPQDLHLAEQVFQQMRNSSGEIVEPVERLPLPVDLQPLAEPVTAGRKGKRGEQVHGQDDPVTDVPVDFSGCFHTFSN